MKYFVYSVFGVPKWVFEFDDAGNLIVPPGMLASLHKRGWEVAQRGAAATPDVSPLEEVDEATAIAARFEIAMDRAGKADPDEMSIGSYVVLPGTRSESRVYSPGEPPAAYGRVIATAGSDYFVLLLLGINHGIPGALEEHVWEAEDGGFGREIYRVSELILGTHYVVKYKYELTKVDKEDLRYLRRAAVPLWGHYPDAELDMEEGGSPTRFKRKSPKR